MMLFQVKNMDVAPGTSDNALTNVMPTYPSSRNLQGPNSAPGYIWNLQHKETYC